MAYFRPISPPPMANHSPLASLRRPQRRRMTTEDWWRMSFGGRMPRPFPKGSLGYAMIRYAKTGPQTYDAERRARAWYERANQRLHARIGNYVPGQNAPQRQYGSRFAEETPTTAWPQRPRRLRLQPT